jgi:hypothetical protein
MCAGKQRVWTHGSNRGLPITSKFWRQPHALFARQNLLPQPKLPALKVKPLTIVLSRID